MYRTACGGGSDATAGNRVLAFVEEYKSPSKLRIEHIRAVLGDEKLPLCMYDIINEATIPPKESHIAHFEYVTRRLTTMALTQVYHYMLQAGAERAMLPTGEALLFLKIDWDDAPCVLLCHVAEPGLETAQTTENVPYCSAVGQLLAFTLCALTSSPHVQDRRDSVIKEAPVWTLDWEHILYQISQDEIDPAPPPSAADLYKPTTYRGFKRSPISLIKRQRIRYFDDAPSSSPAAQRRDNGHSSDEDDSGSTSGDTSDTGGRQLETASVLTNAFRGS